MTRQLPLSSWLCHTGGVALVCRRFPAQTGGQWRLVFSAPISHSRVRAVLTHQLSPKPQVCHYKKACQATSQSLEISHDSSEPQSLTWMQSMLLASPPHDQQSICTHSLLLLWHCVCACMLVHLVVAMWWSECTLLMFGSFLCWEIDGWWQTCVFISFFFWWNVIFWIDLYAVKRSPDGRIWWEQTIRYGIQFLYATASFFGIWNWSFKGSIQSTKGSNSKCLLWNHNTNQHKL